MDRYGIVNHKIVKNGEELENPSDKEVVLAVCQMLSHGHGLTTIFDTEKELAGDDVFMYLTDFFELVENNEEFEELYDKANDRRIKIVIEAMHAKRKELDKAPEDKALWQQYRVAVDAAKTVQAEITTKIKIQNNQIFPDKLFSEAVKKTPHPLDQRKTDWYKKMLREFSGNNPDRDFVHTHFDLDGHASTAAQDMLKLRGIRSDENPYPKPS